MPLFLRPAMTKLANHLIAEQNIAAARRLSPQTLERIVTACESSAASLKKIEDAVIFKPDGSRSAAIQVVPGWNK